MGKYIMQINKSLYFRKRIPQALSHYFNGKSELRIKFGAISHFHGNMYAKELNFMFEELITMLQSDTTNKNELVSKYTDAMYCYSNNSSRKYTIPITVPDLEKKNEELNEKLHEKIDNLTFKEKKKLLENLDVFDKLIHIIDPKKDFANYNSAQSTASQMQKANITLKELYEIFIREKQQESGEDIAQSTWRDYQSSYNDFIYVIEDADNRDISSFTREDFRTFVDALHNHLPKSRTKLKQFKSLPYSTLKDMELTEDEKLASNTKKKKMSTIKQMFDIAMDARYCYIETNYAEAFLIKETKSKKNEQPKRTPLTDTNQEKLFNSKLYTTHKKSTLKYEPEKYWIPLIALYTGMRQNEICQLYIEDVKSEVISTGETVYYFDLNEDKDKHLKNDNAYRLIPIHPKLIELGFIDYFNSIKEKQERLWDNLRLHPTQKRYNTDYNKTFMKYFRTHVTKDPTQVFHSFRHTVGDQLLKNAVKHKLPKDLMNQILGHEPDKDETSRTYSCGYGIEELFIGVCTLEFDLFY
ncbi:site-specific integrase [Sulfurimonas paralvinellae]|uniref:Site-specific integrase n=1 Tax=Sulfurimonas paralvinellae TaxID=317658 RepID=A0A7M1B7L6_9BACT|nr:site-specific integrase [Sulfurimonas paralvinellae]QOP45694.1 site-specific integrase [Sulfurimonas paralvinellae]